MGWVDQKKEETPICSLLSESKKEREQVQHLVGGWVRDVSTPCALPVGVAVDNVLLVAAAQLAVVRAVRGVLHVAVGMDLGWVGELTSGQAHAPPINRTALPPLPPPPPLQPTHFVHQAPSTTTPPSSSSSSYIMNVLSEAIDEHLEVFPIHGLLFRGRSHRGATTQALGGRGRPQQEDRDAKGELELHVGWLLSGAVGMGGWVGGLIEVI